MRCAARWRAVVLRGFLVAAGALLRRPRWWPRGHEVIVLGPAETWGGSLGDHAMLLGAAQVLAGAGWRVTVLHPQPLTGYSATAARVAVTRAGSWHSMRHLARWFALPPSAACVVGADVIDGCYGTRLPLLGLGLLDRAVRAGRAGALVGFSWRSTPSPAVVERITRLPAAVRFVARDDASRTRCAMSTGRTVGVAPDLAFLLQPCGSPRVAELADWITAQRAAGHVILAVAPNGLLARSGAHRHGAALASMAAAVPQPALLLVEHDDRGDPSDRDVVVEFERHMAQVPVRRLTGWSAGEVKAAMELVDLLVAGRMHAAIGALGVGTPVLVLGYAEKAAGLLALFDLSDREIDHVLVEQAPAEAAAALERALAEAAGDREKIRDRIGEVVAAANTGLLAAVAPAVAPAPLGTPTTSAAPRP